MRHESFCPKCGAPMEHELQFKPPANAAAQPELVPAYAPCQVCHALLRTTGLPFFESVVPEQAPVAVFAQYKRFLEGVAAQRLADAKGERRIVL